MTKQFTPKQLTVIDATLMASDNFLDYPRVASIVIEFTSEGCTALAKAEAGVYLTTLRRQQKNPHAVFSLDETNAILKILSYETEENGNSRTAIRCKLLYGSQDGATAKRLKDAVASGACADISEALAQGRGKPPTNEAAKTSAAYLVRANGERMALTDAQYAAVLIALKLNVVTAPF